MGNYQDAKMKTLSKIGNGNYAYIDQIDEARKMLVREMGATLLTVANDVKLQVEFNPARVAAYRLIGYENRLLRDEDFTDDKKDAGDMGAGHTVTALYEVVPKGVTGTITVRESDPLRYTTVPSTGRDESTRLAANDELLYVNLRYKTPGESVSKLLGKAVRTGDVKSRASDDLRFAASVASFGMLLRNSEYKGDATSASVLQLAREASGDDDYRHEFVRLVERWQQISHRVADSK
jgi:Ca-activated chloride channel family protein